MICVRRWVAVLAMFALAGCVPPPPDGGGPAIIGTLDVDGPNAFRNGARTGDGARIVDGDTVSTGPGTSVKILLRGGGYVQLDQNTDPEFRIFVEGGCILVKILTGQMFVDAKRVCISDANIEVALNSRVNLSVAGPRSTLTVLQGSVTMSHPTRVTLEALHQYTVIRGEPPRSVRLSPAQAEAAAAWTERYFRAAQPQPTGWCCTDGRLAFSTPDRCRESRGTFFTDESDARRYCAPRSQPDGWCCANGQVFQATGDRCGAARGQWFSDESTARRVCSPPLGWCCANGQVFQATGDRCGAARGQWFGDEGTARRVCAPPAGWCCANGQVFQTTSDRCGAARGQFYTDEMTARRVCAPRSQPDGWCCANGQVSQTTGDRCGAMGGRFFTDEGSARQACAPPRPPTGVIIRPEVLRVPLAGWCCIGESVSPMNSDQCGQSRGRFFPDEASARRACTLR